MFKHRTFMLSLALKPYFSIIMLFRQNQEH